MWFKKKDERNPPQFRYRFDPLPDITAFELAQIFKLWDWSKGRSQREVNDYIAAHTEGVRRHLKREPYE